MSDDNNSANEALAAAASSRGNDAKPIIKAGMLRMSSLFGGQQPSSTTATSTSSASAKSFLRPATFRVDSVSSDAAATDASPSSGSASASEAANNPFATMLGGNAEAPDTSETTSGGAGSSSSGSGSNSADGVASSAAKNGSQPTNGLATKAANLFKTANPTIPTSTSTGPTDFVFGQNVHERVTIQSINDCPSSTASSSSSSAATSSASSNQLFAIAAAAGSSHQQQVAGANASTGGGSATVSTSTSTASSSGTPQSASSSGAETPTVESLSEAARVYEESRAQKRKYDEVETFTGEEGETNVMDVNCKLFAFVASNWEERGPGNLRVNDNKDRSKSPRVVFRTSGNLRVLLNTQIWPGMVVERPSQKSMRFSAIDADGQIRVFLAMARPDDVSILLNQLKKRIQYEKSRPPKPVRPASSPAADAHDDDKADDDDDDDEEGPGYLDPAVVDIQTDGEREAIASASERDAELKEDAEVAVEVEAADAKEDPDAASNTSSDDSTAKRAKLNTSAED